MRFLKVARADLRRRDLRRDGEHRHARTVAVEQTIDEVQIARSAAAGAHREIAGQMRLGAGRKRGDLLVPDMDPLDLALAAHRVGQSIQAVADDAVDSLDASGGERLRESGLLQFLPCRASRPD